MKLIFCPFCHDVVKLQTRERACLCGRASGHYEADGLNAVVSSDAIPLGFANNSFVEALKNRPRTGFGRRFDAFVIPEECSTIAVKKE